MASKLESILELNSHADTCVLGSHAYIFQDFQRPVRVFGYDPDMGTETYCTMSGEIKYDNPHR